MLQLAQHFLQTFWCAAARLPLAAARVFSLVDSPQDADAVLTGVGELVPKTPAWRTGRRGICRERCKKDAKDKK
jgi:hypothetical protein